MNSEYDSIKPASAELERLRRKIAELKLIEDEHAKADEALLEREEKFRTLIENVNFGIYRNTGGPHGRFLQSNPALARMFGYDSVEEFMKVTVSDLYQNPEERKIFIEEAERNGFLKEKEICLKRKDGTQFVGSCTSKVQYDEDGNIKWIDGVVQDITERKQAEEKLEKSSYYEHTISSVLKIALEPLALEEKLIRILDLILAIPFLSLQTKGCIYLVEDYPEVLVMKAQRGFAEDELSECSRLPFGSNLCGKAALTCKTIYSGSVPGNYGKHRDSSPHGQYCVPISSGSEVYGILSIILKEGHKRDAQEEKFLTSITNMVAGIIERRKAEMEKERLQQQLIQSEKLSALGRMTSNVAHEIRNPITVLGGLAKRLGRTLTGGSREKEYADIIVSEAARLEKILSSVLSFTSEERIHKKLHSINEIINESLRVMEALYKEKQIRIEKSFDGTLQVTIDKDRVREVVDNLISNAAEAIQDGGEIIIDTGREYVKGIEYVTVKVTDTGKGLSREELNNIFEPFFTTKAVGTGDGIGLGLSICKKIMDEHGGFIKVKSAVGEGSTFTLYFPVEIIGS